MPEAAPKNPDLHGNAPDQSIVALLLIDVINDLEFEGGDRLLERALPMADRLASLKRRCRAAGIPMRLRQRQLRPLAIRLQPAGRALPAPTASAADRSPSGSGPTTTTTSS